MIIPQFTGLVKSDIAWLIGWNYRKSHIIIGGSDCSENENITIRLHYSNGNDYQENVYFNELCDSNFSDIRVTSDDGETLLPYQINFSSRIETLWNLGTSQPNNAINLPYAWVYNDAMYVVLQGNSSDCDPYIMMYNYTIGEWSDMVYIADNPLSNDDHGAPVVFVTNDGYIHVLYGGHHSPYKHAKSDNPENISSWTVQTDLAVMTYPRPYMIGNNVYLIYRDSGRDWALAKSTNNASSFSVVTTFLTNSPNDCYISPECIFGDTVYFMWCESVYPLAQNGYFAKLNVTSGICYNATDYNLGSQINNAEYSSCVVELNTASYEISSVNARSGNTGTPYCIYQIEDSDGWKWRFAEFNGVTWNIETICYDDGEYGGCDFKVNSDETITAFLTCNGTTSRGGDMLRYEYNGTNWNLDSVILAESQVDYPLNSPCIPRYENEYEILFCEINPEVFTSNLCCFAWSNSVDMYITISDDLTTGNSTIYIYYGNSTVNYDGITGDFTLTESLTYMIEDFENGIGYYTGVYAQGGSVVADKYINGSHSLALIDTSTALGAGVYPIGAYFWDNNIDSFSYWSNCANTTSGVGGASLMIVKDGYMEAGLSINDGGGGTVDIMYINSAGSWLTIYEGSLNTWYGFEVNLNKNNNTWSFKVYNSALVSLYNSTGITMRHVSYSYPDIFPNTWTTSRGFFYYDFICSPASLTTPEEFNGYTNDGWGIQEIYEPPATPTPTPTETPPITDDDLNESFVIGGLLVFTMMLFLIAVIQRRR